MLESSLTIYTIIPYLSPRDMVLDSQRDRANQLLDRYAKGFMKYNPNTLTAISLLFSALAGGAYALSSPEFPWPLLLVPVLIFINSFLDVVDGYVARKTGRASARGDFLDHVVDRYADLFMILGIAFSGFCNTILGLMAAISVMLVSYMGTQAQAVGAGRDYHGLLGRADRLVILMLLPWPQFIMAYTGYTIPTMTGIPLYLTDLAMIWFIIAGNITAIDRAIATWRYLDGKA